MPLVFTFVRLIFFGFLQLVGSMVYAFILHPLFAFIFFIWGLIRYLWSSITDKIMWIFIRFLGRQPRNDSFIAKKIAGAGMGRVHVATIDLSDLKIFVMAQMEMIMLQQYEENIRSKKILRQPINDSIDCLNEFTGNLYNISAGGSVPMSIEESCYKLEERLRNQIEQRLKHLPDMPSVPI
jgi:hypothetical protein